MDGPVSFRHCEQNLTTIEHLFCQNVVISHTGTLRELVPHLPLLWVHIHADEYHFIKGTHVGQ